jgi:hypothetical protein
VSQTLHDWVPEAQSVAVPVAIGAAGGAARFVMARRGVTLAGFIRGMFIALCCGASMHALLGQFGLTEGARGALTGAAAFIADDLLIGLALFGHQFARNPLATIFSVRNVATGSAPVAAEPDSGPLPTVEPPAES